MALWGIIVQEDPGGASLLEDGTGEELWVAVVTAVFGPLFREPAYTPVFRESAYTPAFRELAYTPVYQED